MSTFLNIERLTGLLRGPAPAVLAVLAVVVVRLLRGWDSPTGESDPWIPWLETAAWDPLRRLVAAGLLATGALLTFRVAARQSGAPRLALGVVLVTTWILQVRGSEAGFLLYAVVLWACDRYIDRPGREGFWPLVLLTVVVTALRVDHALYVATAAVAALIVRHARDGARAVGTATLAYAGALAVVALTVQPLGQLHTGFDRLASRIASVVAARDQFRASSNATLDPPGLAIKIRWAPGVDAAEREAREREYALASAEQDRDDPSGRTWQYRWDGTPPGGLRRMLNDRAVEDTQGVDRDPARFGWMRALLWRASELASGGVRWSSLWVILPVVAVLRLAVRAIRRTTVHPDWRVELTALPALVLCVPMARLVVQGAPDAVPIAAPVMPALAIVAAWLLTPVVPGAIGGRVRPMTQPRRAELYICSGLALLTVFIHLHVNTDVTNDHAAYLAMARQIVYGDWPIRDFRDDGSLLQILLSAAVQKIGGFHLLGEMLLSWTFFAASGCLTYWLASRLSRSHVVAAVAAGLAALLVPRPYAYPKLFIYPLALLVIWRYVERPQRGRLAAVAATIALAFLFRIDHGVVIAATSVFAVAAVHVARPHAIVREGLRLAGWLALFTLPQVAYIAWSAGPRRYIESIATFGAYAHATREPFPLFSAADGLLTQNNAATFLLYVFLGIVGTTLVYAVTHAARAWRQGKDIPREALQILVVAVMWVLMLPMLARGQYYTRISEIGQPVAILGAWLWMTSLRPLPGRSVRVTAAAALLAATVWALSLRVPLVYFFTSPAKVFEGAPFQRERFEAWAMLPIDSYAPAEVEGDRWIVRYAQRCTKPTDRLLVTWFGPEVYFFAGRPFAGDRWAYLPFDNSPERQTQVAERLRAQPVPVVLVNLASYPQFRAAWPGIASYLDEAYDQAADVPIGPHPVTRVLTHKSRVPSRHLSFAHLPCFD